MGLGVGGRLGSPAPPGGGDTDRHGTADGDTVAALTGGSYMLPVLYPRGRA